MAAKILPSQEYLRECFDYDSETGVLTWRARPLYHFVDHRVCALWNTKRAGKAAGCPDKRGYLWVTVNRKHLAAHRVIWKLTTGNEPPPELDHKDVDAGNNRFDNLRPATTSENGCNVRARRTNTLGVKGVYCRSDGSPRPFMAQIQVKGRHIHIGSFATVEEAKNARDTVARQLHADFFRY